MLYLLKTNDSVLTESGFAEDACLNTINAWHITGSIIYVLKIMVPILLIIFAIKPIFNVIMKGTANEISVSLKTLATKLIIAMLVFMAPTIVSKLISTLVDTRHSFKKCNQCLTYPFSTACSKYIDDYYAAIAKDAEDLDSGQNVTGDSEKYKRDRATGT